jgi:hypothetical protein
MRGREIKVITIVRAHGHITILTLDSEYGTAATAMFVTIRRDIWASLHTVI